MTEKTKEDRLKQLYEEMLLSASIPEEALKQVKETRESKCTGEEREETINTKTDDAEVAED